MEFDVEVAPTFAVAPVDRLGRFTQRKSSLVARADFLSAAVPSGRERKKKHSVRGRNEKKTPEKLGTTRYVRESRRVLRFKFAFGNTASERQCENGIESLDPIVPSSAKLGKRYRHDCN